ncbi:MAG TPA: XRE family transcriptional regulator [Bacteriovoracaceae bacterium]|nr:XRE family transcriptional regulator [Bacteriovoracaceae bacterium]
MNPYHVDIDSLKESRKITDEKDLLKLRLVAGLLKIISKMETSTILEQTGLDKSDLSRLRTFNLDRFSIDRIIGLLNNLGFSTKVSIVPSDKAS